MIELKDFTLRVYKVDRRRKEGERLVKSYQYTQKHEQWMKEEVQDLQSGLYPRGQWRLEYFPTWVVVRNLMTGKEVQIPAEDRGGPCDPSMERYWSM